MKKPISYPLIIKTAMERQGIKSRYELAKVLGVSNPTVYDWSNEKANPSGEHALILFQMASGMWTGKHKGSATLPLVLFLLISSLMQFIGVFKALMYGMVFAK